ncbi:MAG: hypothetical protein B7Y90_08160 [Alphaproteobacteria bacterium 32-64-14]|nr:MAG: hypothetical protein B7Y90_08160 [Alphaproteobacteria bacterium 32-64-14]
MIEVLRTNNPIRLDYAVVLLKRAGCHPFVADRFMAAAEGGIPALERRVMVPDEWEAVAREALKQLDAPQDPLPEDGGEDDGAGDDGQP